MSVVPEQLEILRRTAERGISKAREGWTGSYIDLFQHLLDEIQRTKIEYYKENK